MHAHDSMYIYTMQLFPHLTLSPGAYLTDGPRSICVHGRVGSPRKWKLSRYLLLSVLSVSLGVYRFDVDTLNNSDTCLYKYNIASKSTVVLLSETLPIQKFPTLKLNTNIVSKKLTET